MKLSKKLILEMVQIIKNEYNSNNYKLMLLVTPAQLEPIKDDIEWKVVLNDTVGSVQLDYGLGILKLSEDISIEVLSTKKLAPNHAPSLMILPTNEVNMRYKFYPYDKEFTFDVESDPPKLPKIIGYERYGSTILNRRD